MLIGGHLAKRLLPYGGMGSSKGSSFIDEEMKS
jgi:hypothetical protein